VSGELGPRGTRSLLGAAVIGTSATLIVGVLGVVRTKVLAVGLDPAGLGLYGQVLTMLTALSAGAGLGLGLGTTRIVAQSRERGDERGLKDALEVSVAIPLAFGSLLAVLIAGLSGVLAPLLLDDDRALLIALGALAVPLVAIQGPLVHSLQGFRDVRGAQGANVFFGVALTVASVVGVLVGDLDGAVLALAVGNLAYALALGWRLRSLVNIAGLRFRLRDGLRVARLREPLIQTMLGIGFASLFVGVASTVGDLVVRTLVLREEGADAAGIFSALQLISVQLIGVVVVSIVFLSFTAISEAHAADDQALVRRTLDDTVRLALLLVLPVLMVLGVFREDVVRLFLSSEFDRATDLFPRELTGDLLRTISFGLGAALVPVGLTRIWVGATTLITVAYVGTAAILVSSNGLDGAVDAYVIQWAAAVIVMGGVLAGRGLFRPSALTWRAFAAGGVLVAVITRPQPGWALAALIAAAYAVALLILCTGRDERDALQTRVAGFLRR
jgi:PST family polysaccharide transporter